MQMSRHMYLLCCYVSKIYSSLNCSFDLDASTYLMAMERPTENTHLCGPIENTSATTPS